MKLTKKHLKISLSGRINKICLETIVTTKRGLGTLDQLNLLFTLLLVREMLVKSPSLTTKKLSES